MLVRQVSPAVWKAIVELKGTAEQQAAFLAEFEAYRNNYATRKQALSAQYKGDFENPAYIAARDALRSELESTMIGYGFYESLTEAQVDDANRSMIVSNIKNYPTLILGIVTDVTNFYRSQNGKEELTEAQVRTRLLA